MSRRLALVGALGLLGLVCGTASDSTILTIALLLFEPLLWLSAVGAAALMLSRRRVADAAVVLAAGALFSIGARLPSPEVEGSGAAMESLGAFGRCADERPRRPLRLVSWNVRVHREPAATARAVRELDADLAVLQEVKDLDVPGAIAEAWDGDMIHADAMLGWGTAVVVRNGGFVECDGRDHRVIQLPAEGDRRAIAVVAVVNTAAGRIPLVTVHTDRPASLGEAARWPELLDLTGRRLAAIVRGIDHPATVLVGDTNTHHTFHRFGGQIRAAGLEPAPLESTWPARLGGMRLLPLYSLDRLWAGPAWSERRLDALRLDPPSDHLAIIAELRP